MWPYTTISATDYKGVAQAITVDPVTTLTGATITLPCKAISKTILSDGSILPSSIKVTISGSSNDSFTEVFSTPVVGKHFFYDESGVTPTLRFDPVYNGYGPINVSYLAKGDAVPASDFNTLTNDLNFIETNLIGATPQGVTFTESQLFMIIPGTLTTVGAGSTTVDISSLIGDNTDIPTGGILVFPSVVSGGATGLTSVIPNTPDSDTTQIVFIASGAIVVNYLVHIYRKIS